MIRDRTFYFGNFERRELNQSRLITIAPADVDTINGRLVNVGYPGSLIIHGNLSQFPFIPPRSWRE
jgi:hypothetical protein